MTAAEATLDLEPGVGAPRRARSFVAEQVATWGCPELADLAALCVSEIVTNAVFHAGSGITVGMRWATPILRVEVADESSDSAIPTAVVAAVAEEDLWGAKASVADATSGRGLFVVASVAKVLGEKRADSGKGKVVWFELDLDSVTADSPRSLGTIVQQLPEEPGTGAGSAVFLTDVPIDQAIGSDSHIEGLLRELQLLAPGDADLESLAERIRAARGLLPFFAHVREQLMIQSLLATSVTDVAMELPTELARIVEQLPAVLDRLDELDDSGVLLTLPASSEIRGWRRRLVAEVQTQLEA